MVRTKIIKDYFLFVLLFCVFQGKITFSATLQSVELVSLAANFTKILVENDIESLTKGSFYLKYPETLLLKINYPVMQDIVINDTLMQIFYPEKHLLYNVNADYHEKFMFLSPFIASQYKDYGLSALSYTLADYQVENDTLITIWQPPKEMGNAGTTVLKTLNDKLVNVVIYDEKDTIVQKIFFKDYQKLGYIGFPGTVEILYMNSEKKTKKNVTLTNLELNKSIPDSLNIDIPENVTIENFEW